MSNGRLFVPARAYLDCDAARGQLRSHGVQYLEQAIRLGHQRRAASSVAHQVDGTGGVEILRKAYIHSNSIVSHNTRAKYIQYDM